MNDRISASPSFPHCRGIDRNSARNYEELRSTKYKSGGKRAKVQWAFPKLQKSNFRGDVTVLSNWCLKIHFFLVMQGIMKSYGRFRVIFPSCWVECHLNCPITLRATKFDYGQNANPDSPNFNGQSNSVPTKAILNLLFYFVLRNWYWTLFYSAKLDILHILFA